MPSGVETNMEHCRSSAWVRSVELGASSGVLVLVLALAGAGCGGGATSETTSTERTERTSGRERSGEEPLPDGASITGLMGTIPARAVSETMDNRMGHLARCFADRSDDVEFLEGDITLSFRVHTDGTVAWVYPSRSTIGDRETEVCILGVARGAHFPRPTGGEAEFTWGFGLDAASDVRLPITWTSDHVMPTIEANRASIASCGRTGFQLTAYVAPGGAVMAVGGTCPDADALAALDCVVSAVRGWTMPNPGSYPAKVSFSL
jgi:hypothetical protein